MPPKSATGPLIAGLYLRISDDQEGLALGVKRQEEDCRALAERAGATVAGVYTDNDVGASTCSRSKMRKEFDHLVADVRSGRINTIIFHSSSRLTRRPLEYESIVQLVEQTGVRLLSVASGNVDLTTADGRLVGRVIAAIDAAESERISERVKRALKQRREDGKGHGGNVMTGWLVPDASKGIGYCTHLDPVAAKHIEDAADWLLSGVTVTQVTNRWNNAEFTTVRGRAWTIATVQALLSSPRLAGLVELDGEIIGRGNWPGILDPVTWNDIQSRVKSKGHRAPGYQTRRHLLSGFIACGLCGGNMRAHTWGDSPRYTCVKTSTSGACGKTSRNMTWLETTVRAYVAETIKQQLTAGPPVIPAVKGSERPGETIATLENRIREAREAAETGLMSMIDAGEIMISLRRKIARSRADQAKAVATERHDDMHLERLLAQWDRSDLETLGERRKVLSTYVKRVLVHPLPRGKWSRYNLPADSITIIPLM